MNALWAVLGFIVVQRLVELAVAARNTRRLRARGAVEAGARHYPLFVALHTGWLAAMVFMIPGETSLNLPFLGVFAALQIARVWVIASLGERWTTRVLVPPGEPIIARGPYRWMRHPNYAVVCAEIAVVPLMFGAWEIALIFSALNLALVGYRIRIEDAALGRRE